MCERAFGKTFQLYITSPYDVQKTICSAVLLVPILICVVPFGTGVYLKSASRRVFKIKYSTVRVKVRVSFSVKLLICSKTTANGLSYVVSIDYRNVLWCTLQVDTGTGTRTLSAYCMRLVSVGGRLGRAPLDSAACSNSQ